MIFGGDCNFEKEKKKKKELIKSSELATLLDMKRL